MESTENIKELIEKTRGEDELLISASYLPAVEYKASPKVIESETYSLKLKGDDSAKFEDSLEAMEETAYTVFNPFIGIKRLPKGSVQFNKDNNNNFLGKGAFGQVYKGKWNELSIALKEIDIEKAKKNLNLTEKEVLEALQWEVSRLATAFHPNLVQFYGLYIEEDEDKNKKTYLVIEYCEGGSLQQVLSKTNPDWSKRLQWALEITQGLAYLHHQGMLHRDLKAENILIDGHGRAKLADLGVAQVDALLQKEEAKVIFKGLQDRVFAAPEALEEASISTSEADIYALGIVFWQLVNQGKKPHTPRHSSGSIDEKKLLERMRTGQRESISTDCPKEFKELILGCWVYEPSKRFSIGQVLERLKALLPKVHPNAHWMSLCQQTDVLIHPKRLDMLSYVPSLVTEHPVYEDLDVYWQRLEISVRTEDEGTKLEEMSGIENPPLKLQQIFSEFLTNPQSTSLLLLGESGLGKTLSTYQLADGLMNEWWEYLANPTKRVIPYFPIFIRPGLLSWSYNELRNGFEKALKNYAKEVPFSVLKEARFLVIVDGYDECEVNEAPINLAEQLGIKKLPSVKLLVTCRPNTVESTALLERFALNGNLMIRHFLPFSIAQLLKYLKQGLHWDSMTYQNYQEKLQYSYSLRAVLRNPFVASLFVQSWDTIKKKDFNQLNRWQIYQSFIEHWIYSQHSLLSNTIKKSLTAQCKSNNTLERLRLVESFNSFASEIAFNAFNKSMIYFDKIMQEKEVLLSQSSQLWLELKAEIIKDSEQSFKQRQERLIKEEKRRALLTKEDYTNIMRWHLQRFEALSPLKNKELLCEFSHKSFYEYFVARRVVELREKAHSAIVEEALELLNHRPIQAESEVMVFLAEGWQEVKTRKLIEPLFEILEHSKQEAFTKTQASANAATALNVGRVSFSGKNLSNIKIPGADLSHGIFYKTNFESAILDGINFENSCLSQANFTDASFKGTNFCERPYIKMGAAEDCCYSKDGKIFAVAIWNKILLYNHESLELINILQAHTKEIKAIAFSPNTNVLASGGSDNIIYFWNTKNGRVIETLSVHEEKINTLAFSSDSALLVSGDDNAMLCFWDVNNRKVLEVLKTGDNGVSAVVFHPNGNILAGGNFVDNTVSLWDVASRKVIKILEGVPGDGVRKLAFSPDGNVLVSAMQRVATHYICFWDIKEGKILKRSGEHINVITDLAFSPDGKILASGSFDHTVRLWDTKSKEVIKIVESHGKDVHSLSFSPDGSTLVSASRDTIRFLDMRNITFSKPRVGHIDRIKSLAFNPNGNLIASGSHDGVMYLWNVENGKMIQSFQKYSAIVNFIAALFSSDGNTLVSVVRTHSFNRGRGDFWDVRSGKKLKEFDVPTKSFNRINVLKAILKSNGELYSGCEEDTALAFNRDETVLASGDKDGNVFLWDKVGISGREFGKDFLIRHWNRNPNSKIGRPLKVKKNHNKAITALAFSPDNYSLVSGSDDCIVCLWNMEYESTPIVLKGHANAVTIIVFSPDGSIMASGSSEAIYFWNIKSGALLKTFKFDFPASAICFNKAFNKFALSTDASCKSIKCWSFEIRGREVYLILDWSAPQNTLSLNNAIIERIKGSTLEQQILFKQRGAVGSLYSEQPLKFDKRPQIQTIEEGKQKNEQVFLEEDGEQYFSFSSSDKEPDHLIFSNIKRKQNKESITSSKSSHSIEITATSNQKLPENTVQQENIPLLFSVHNVNTSSSNNNDDDDDEVDETSEHLESQKKENPYANYCIII